MVLLVHHANKTGGQRGSSQREDVLDAVTALRRREDREPAVGARFEVYQEKARGILGDAARPFEARLVETPEGGWTGRFAPLAPASASRRCRCLLRARTVCAVAAEMGFS